MKKKFHILDVMSITTERLVSTRHMDGIYDILGFMHDASLFTTQLPSAAEAAKPEIFRQHPALLDFDADIAELTRMLAEHGRPAWLDLFRNYAEKKYGVELEIERMPAANRKQSDPMDGIPAGVKVVGVVVGGGAA